MHTVNWRCHAWCLVDNHILIETTEGNLSQGMRQFNRVYTQKRNRERVVPADAQGRRRGFLPGACIVSQCGQLNPVSYNGSYSDTIDGQARSTRYCGIDLPGYSTGMKRVSSRKDRCEDWRPIRGGK
jgi:hypothetical protein